MRCLSTRFYDLTLRGILLGTSYILFRICRNPFFISGSVLTVFKIVQNLYGTSSPKLFLYFLAHFHFGKNDVDWIKCKWREKIFKTHRITQLLEISVFKWINSKNIPLKPFIVYTKFNRKLNSILWCRLLQHWFYNSISNYNVSLICGKSLFSRRQRLSNWNFRCGK